MNSSTMAVRRICTSALFLASVSSAFASAPVLAADNTFDRNFNVSGHVRIELSNGSGNVEIRGSGDGKVHVYGKVTPGWSVFGSSEKNVQEVVATPPLEQHDSVIRIGKNSNWIKNISIEYKIDAPRDTEIDAGVASGGISIDNFRGPVKASAASGYVHVYRVAGDVNMNAPSGSTSAPPI